MFQSCLAVCFSPILFDVIRRHIAELRSGIACINSRNNWVYASSSYRMDASLHHVIGKVYQLDYRVYIVRNIHRRLNLYDVQGGVIRFRIGSYLEITLVSNG